jgi:hypothetical protein
MEQMKKESDVYKLKLGETKETIDWRFHVTRVPGGWIYTCIVNDGVSTTFVPESDNTRETERSGRAIPAGIMTFDGTMENAIALKEWLPSGVVFSMEYEDDGTWSLVIKYGDRAQYRVPVGYSIIKKVDGSVNVVKL